MQKAALDLVVKVSDVDTAKDAITAKFLPVLLKAGADNMSNRPLVRDIVVR